MGTGLGWFAAKEAYGVEEPSDDIETDPSAVKPLTVEESVDALMQQVQTSSLLPGAGY